MPLSHLLLLFTLPLWGTMAFPSRSATPLDCSKIYDPGNGWIIEYCPTDPQVGETMDIWLDGTYRGQAARLQIYHQYIIPLPPQKPFPHLPCGQAGEGLECLHAVLSTHVPGPQDVSPRCNLRHRRPMVKWQSANLRKGLSCAGRQ
jgi:hypothetical protein